MEHAVKRLLREPLLHFLLLSGLIFAIYGVVAQRDDAPSREIVVSTGKIRSMAALFERTWQRPPTAAELQGLIDDYVREEVLYREGVAMGLDRDDTVVRRRVGQKMEFVSEELVAPAEPTDAELQTYPTTHAAAFAIEPRFTFQQIHFDPQRRGTTLADDVERLRRELRSGAAPADVLGDSTMLPREVESAPAAEVQATFGKEFAEALATIPPGEWVGPMHSSYGVHLVLLRQRKAPHLPLLDDVRQAVAREWARERQEEAAAGLYRRLLEQYTVTVEQRSLEDTAMETGSIR